MNNRRLPSNSHVHEATLLTELSEAELLTEAATFNEAALSELYDRYEAKIYTYIYRRTNDPNLAEDLAAQVFLKMLEAIRNGNAWRSSFSGWLYRIAHNQVIDYYRARDRRKNVGLDDGPVLTDQHDSHNPVHAAETQLNIDQLRSAIRRLTDEQAEVISLRHMEGYSFGEIAKMMDKTEGAVKALQHRAFATLRQFLSFERTQEEI